ncbi:hypothetical protein HOM98_02020 [Candidatus Peregrinibacteria bacterium]|jgi:hypothetical protein|nr:hypothetical protein [Candidatus Peregrinibacteria bacterium]MBT7484673.1 hypothetical protein [Candidatus Peregrinibacteria bacterium]
MKKLTFIIVLLTFVGCIRADLETLIYQDPDDRFVLEYPVDWSVTKSHDEVQFWDSLENPSLKMALFETQASDFEQLQIGFELDDDFLEMVVDFVELHGLPVMIKKGSFMSDFQVYYYNLGEEIIGFSAYYSATTPGHLDQVTQIQQSFRTG